MSALKRPLLKNFFVFQKIFKMLAPSDLNPAIDMPLNEERLVWVDCEMTGLDPDKNRLVEIACIITEGNLKIVAECGPILIKQPSHIMEGMNDVVKEMFVRNGLLERLEKEGGIDESEAENKLLDFVRLHTPPGKCQLSGNTVHADRRFLLKYMPKFCEHLHYRIVDVSSIKELVNRWYKNSEELANMPPKKFNHLAMDDIRESIEELDYYRKHFFK